MTARAETYLRRLGSMQATRKPAEKIWKACYDLTFPERGEGFDGQNTADPGGSQAKRAEMMDSTAPDSARLLASQIVSGMTPANAVWAFLDVGDESEDERRWLDHASRVCWEKIHGANYDAAAFECKLDAVVAGWFVQFVDQDRETFDLRFEQWPIAQCYIASSKPSGPIDIIYREFMLTATQAVGEYGDKVSAEVREAAEGEKPDTLFKFVHCIQPRAKAGGMLSKNLPFESLHIECGTKTEVRESGYHEFPCSVPRWMRLPNSPYGIGPLYQALPAVRTLNELLRLEMVALGRAAAGVYVAEDDGVLNPRAVKVKGGSVIVANSVDSIKPLPSGADFNVSFSKADQLRAEIRKLMLSDQLQPQDGPTMTATEVHVRVALIRQLLGPVYGRFQAEDLRPTIDRVFGLLYRQGRPEIGGPQGPIAIDDAPDTIKGLPFMVRYQSPLARAQRLEDVTAIERMLGLATAFAGAGMPEALDVISPDEAMRAAADGLGAPMKTTREPKEIEAIRKARQEQQAEQAEAAQQQQMQTMAAEAGFQRAAAA